MRAFIRGAPINLKREAVATYMDAAYLFNKSPPEERKEWKIESEQERFKEALKNDLPPPI